MQKLKDIFGVGGHVYGYGAYFAAYALYSHWWNTRVWQPKSAAKSVFTVYLYPHIVVHSVFSVCVGDGVEPIPVLLEQTNRQWQVTVPAHPHPRFHGQLQRLRRRMGSHVAGA